MSTAFYDINAVIYIFFHKGKPGKDGEQGLSGYPVSCLQEMFSNVYPTGDIL